MIPPHVEHPLGDDECHCVDCRFERTVPLKMFKPIAEADRFAKLPPDAVAGWVAEAARPVDVNDPFGIRKGAAEADARLAAAKIIYRDFNDGVDALPATRNCLPDDDAARLDFPMFDGLMAYFPNALAEVSRVSKIGNDQHNPGQPMHWARGKSTDHENKIMRHLAESGGIDSRGVRHSARLAWRAMALLQEELEREAGAPLSRGSQRTA